MFFGRVESQYLASLCRTFGPFDQQPLFGPAFRACVISMRSTRPARERERDDGGSAVPSRHSTLRQDRLGRLRASSSTEIGLCSSVATKALQVVGRGPTISSAAADPCRASRTVVCGKVPAA